MKAVRSTFLLCISAAAAAAIACSSTGEPAAPAMPATPMATEPTTEVSPTDPMNTAVDGDSGLMPDAAVPGAPSIRPSKLLAGLVAAGVEVDVPLAEAMDHAERVDELSGNHDQVRAIMGAFTKALGVECKDCHALRDAPVATDGGSFPLDAGALADAGRASDGGTRPAPLDFEKPTAMKNVATRMWDRWAVGLQFKDTKAQLFCDSCHQGKEEFLDRSDKDALALWMRNNFVAKVETREGTGLKCGSCHGTPFAGEFLEEWETPLGD